MDTPTFLHNFIRRRRQLPLGFGANRFLSMLEGLEGGFAVSTGVIAGLSFANITDRRILLITAAVTILVSGFNAAAVTYSSEHYVDELDGKEMPDPWKAYFVPAAIQFVMYFLVCMLTLIPLALFSDIYVAVAWCTVVTTVVLFTAGMWRGYLLGTKPVRDGLELSLLGLLIIAIGAGAGYTLSL